MKLISRKILDSKIITDLSTGEKIDISKMGASELEELQHQVELSEEDFETIQVSIINSKVGAAEFRNDMQKEKFMKDIPTQVIIAKTVVKTAQEFEAQPKFNPGFDIKQAVKNDDDAAAFVTDVILKDPASLPAFLGMSQNELYKRVNDSLGRIMKDAPPQAIEVYNKTMPKDYIGIMKFLGNLLYMLNPTLSSLKKIICPLMGFQIGKNDLVKRLYDYVPLAIGGSEELEKEMEENKGDQKAAIDRILDKYNTGKINRQQMENMMKEFASYRPVLLKTANKLEIKWEKDIIRVIKTANGKYKMSKDSWERIGRTAGWLGNELV